VQNAIAIRSVLELNIKDCDLGIKNKKYCCCSYIHIQSHF